MAPVQYFSAVRSMVLMSGCSVRIMSNTAVNRDAQTAGFANCLAARYLRRWASKRLEGASYMRRNTTTQLIFVLVTLLSSGQALSQNTETAEQDVCERLQDQADFLDCLNKTEEAMKIEYESVFNSLVPADKWDTTDYAKARRLLDESQQSWSKYAESYCGAKYELFVAGADRSRLSISCSLQMTQQRVEELKRWPD
jgi:uncharacterized protein YecT (DUF1311 family)